MDDDLCIRIGCERVTPAREFLLQVGVVVNFPIVNNPDGTVYIAYGLMARR
jgi:hypothetical protein